MPGTLDYYTYTAMVRKLKTQITAGSKQMPRRSDNQIRPNDYNPNRMSPGHYKALKQAILKDGFVGVLLVNHTPDGYVIIDGEHRWRVARDLGRQAVPCIVVESPPDRAKALTIKLNQNHQRRKLLDEALLRAKHENQDQENPRGGCLEVILHSYLNAKVSRPSVLPRPVCR